MEITKEDLSRLIKSIDGLNAHLENLGLTHTAQFVNKAYHAIIEESNLIVSDNHPLKIKKETPTNHSLINRSMVEKIRNRYNPDYDTPPDAPIQWSVMELAELVNTLCDRIETLESKQEV